MDRAHLDLLDRAMLACPLIPDDWVPSSATDLCFGWDPGYTSSHGQSFTPWMFMKNSAAVLGHARLHGPTDLMKAMSRHLVDVLLPHIAWDDTSAYVVNDFVFPYLWREFTPPFYGAFMNGVTAYGLLYLFEATGDLTHRSLARFLLGTMINPNLKIPLMTEGAGQIWLHEYVWRSDSPAPPGITVSAGWNCSEIYNGHIHALLPLMRFKAMTGEGIFDATIEGALNTVRIDFGQQIFEGRYFSYSKEMPEYPDYGQARAWLLLDGLAKVTGEAGLAQMGQRAQAFYEAKIEGRDRDILRAGINACRPAALAQMAPEPAEPHGLWRAKPVSPAARSA